MAKARDEGLRFDAVKLDGLYDVLDAVAWMDGPTAGEIAQYAGLDPRTVGKLLKNATSIALIDKIDSGYVPLVSYPYKGTAQQKSDVVKSALIALPLLISFREFRSLGDSADNSLRKAATVNRILPFNAAQFSPLMTWASQLAVLDHSISSEDIADQQQAAKEVRHEQAGARPVAFLSHSSSDKAFMRRLAVDLERAGINVWLDEQRIKVGESISDKIGQGLAAADFFLIANSRKSVESEWVKKELGSALMTEVARRKVHVLPLKLDNAGLPPTLIDKRYADFSSSYNEGFAALTEAMETLND